MNRVIYACDIGSTRSGAFAWARVLPGLEKPRAGKDIAALVRYLIADAEHGLSIALGFESPLFLPVPHSHEQLSRGRARENNRSMFAPAGAGVATLGVHQAAWILRAVRDKVGDQIEYTLDWDQWPPATDSQQLLIWEAFVSGNAHSKSHEHDAVTAAVSFRDNESKLDVAHAVTAESPLSMVHAVAIWAGWATDIERLHEECFVLRPESAYAKEWESVG